MRARIGVAVDANTVYSTDGIARLVDVSTAAMRVCVCARCSVMDAQTIAKGERGGRKQGV